MNNNVQHGGRQGTKGQPGRGESNMASDHDTQSSHAKPMRAAAVQSDTSSRFQVAGHEHGGTSPHHHHHHVSKQPESIPAGKPVNRMDQQLEHNNQGSKGFVYRDEDFQPLKSSPSPASNVSQKSASAPTVPRSKSYSQATSDAGSVSSPSTHTAQNKHSTEHDEATDEQHQSRTGATRHHHHGNKHKHDDDSMHHRHVAMHESLARDDAPTPEMHLETLFSEEDGGRMKSRAPRASPLSSSTTSARDGQPLRNVSSATPRQNEDTGHDSAQAGGNDGFQGYVFHPPTLARDHNSRQEQTARPQAAPAHDSEMQKVRHVPSQRPEYHAPFPTAQPQRATIERVSAPRQQASHKPSATPPKKKTWYGAEVPVKQKANTSKSSTGSKHPLSLGFGFREIRKVAQAGQAHSSGPSTPVSSSEYTQAARTNVPLQSAPLHEDQREASHTLTSQSATGSTHQVLGQPYEEPGRVDKAHHEDAARESSGVHPASHHVPLQNQGHSSTFDIKDSTDNSHSRSNASADSKLDQAAGEPSDQRATNAQGGTVAAAENALLAGLGNIRSMVDAALHVPAMVAHALLPEDDELLESTATAHSHDHTTLGPRTMRRGHSKAVMLKRPSVDLTLYPEEDPSYPRGDGEFHENPPFPSVALKYAEQKAFHPLSPALFKDSGHAKSRAMHSASSSSADTRPAHGYNHSKAAVLKRPSENVMLFPEEDGSYPRDNCRRHHENPDHPSHLVKDVHEIQLDADHLHPHHDLHPTIGESAVAAITSGVEGMRAMLSGINLHYISDSLLAPEGRSDQGGQHSRPRRHSNPAAGAVLSQLGRSSQSPEQRDAHGSDESFSHRGDAYYGQHGSLLTEHTHATSNKPVSASKVPLETGHRGDAYFGQHGDMASSASAESKERANNTFPLESGHRGDAYFGQHDAPGDHHSSSSRSSGPIYSPPSSTVNTNQQRNFPLEARHRGDAYYGQYDSEGAPQGGKVPAQTNLYPAAVQQVEQENLQQRQDQHQRQPHPGLAQAQGHALPLQSHVAQPTRPSQPSTHHLQDHTPSRPSDLPEHANAYPAAVQELDHTVLNRPQRPVPIISPAVVREHQASIQQQQQQQQQQQEQQQQPHQSVPPEHANVYASAVRQTEQQQQGQQQGQPSLQEPLNEGEKVVWVKKVKTTEEFYDPEDDDGGLDLDRNIAHPAPGASQLPHQHQGQTAAGRRQPAGPAQ